MSNGSLPAGEGEFLPLDAPDQPKSSGWRKRLAAQDFLDQHTTKRVDRRETPQSNASPAVSMASDPPMNYDRGQSSHPSTTNTRNHIHPDRLLTNFQSTISNGNIRDVPLSPTDSSPSFPKSPALDRDDIKRSSSYHPGGYAYRPAASTYRPYYTDSISSRHSKLDRIDTETEPENRLIRMNNSPECSMAPPTEGRRSTTTISVVGGHSGSSTPKSLPTSMTPVPQSSSTSSRSKKISENFAQYTQAVLNYATRTVRRDTIKARLEKQMLERDKWQKHALAFATMAEEQNRQLSKCETASERSEESLRNLNEIQTKAINGMTSCMVAASHGKPMPSLEEDTPSKHLAKEVAALRDEVRSINRTIENTTQDISRFKDNVSFQGSQIEKRVQSIYRDSVTKQTLTEAESKIAEATVNISKLQVSSMKQAELNEKMSKIQEQLNRSNNLASDITKLKEDISQISANGITKEQEGQKLKEDHESHVKDFQKLTNDVDEQKEKFMALNDFVTGNEMSDEKGLTDIVQEGVRNSAKHAEALRTLNDELGELNNLKEEFKDHGERIEKLESGSTKQPQASSDSRQIPIALDGEVAILREEVARITEEQQIKDDLVADEMEELNKLVTQKNGQVEQLSQIIDSQGVLVKAMNDQISQLHSRATAEEAQMASKPSGESNSVQSPDKPVRQKLVELETNLKQFQESSWEKQSQMEVFVNSHEQRFNNLMTDHMTRKMVNQMQLMYPNHPGNVMRDLQQIRGQQVKLENMSRSVEGRLAEIRDYLAPAQTILAQKRVIPDLQVALRKVSDKVGELAKTHQGSSLADKAYIDLIQRNSTEIERFKADINTIKQEHLSAVETLNTNFKAIKQDHLSAVSTSNTNFKNVDRDIRAAAENSKTNLEAIKADIREIEATTITECSVLHGEIAALSEQIERSEQKPASAKKERRSTPVDNSDNSPSIRPSSLRRNKRDQHLQAPAAADESDNSFSPSRQRAGSVRSAASAAKAKLAETKFPDVTSNGGFGETLGSRKSRRKRERGSEGSESDWCPSRKVSRMGGE